MPLPLKAKVASRFGQIKKVGKLKKVKGVIRKWRSIS
jgi:hypothetical protein